MKAYIPEAVFREYDIRGLADTEITAAFAYCLAQAYASMLPENESQPVVVGRDVRLSGLALQQAVIQGLLDAGLDVLDVGMVPTPLVYYALYAQKAAGCIMVTASHNPAPYNGFKLMIGQRSFHGEDIQHLKHVMQQHVKVEGLRKGQVRSLDVVPAYADFVVGDCQLQRPLKVVIDAGNGPSGYIAEPLYQRLGCEVVPLHCEPDGSFPNHHPDPTVVENMQDIATMVKQTNADIGIAYDGDGDRIGVVDEKGEIIWGDMLLLLLARELLLTHPGATIISEIKSSQLLYDDIRAHGGTAVMWRTGHSPMKSKMKETNALLAGEMSGHFFFADRFYGFDDAIYAGARLMQLLAAQNKPLSALLDGVPKRFSTVEIRVDCPDALKFELVENAKIYFSKDDCDIITIDGMRLTYAYGWALLRASNTQPALVMRYEAIDETQLKVMQDRMESWVQAYLLDHKVAVTFD